MTTATKIPLADAMGAELQAKTARRSAFDTLRATPAKARVWVASTLRSLKLDGLARSIGEGANWIYQRILRAGKFLRGLGLLNIAGFVITWRTAREAVVKVAAKAYAIVRKPFEWLHRGLSWLCRKVGFAWGVKQLDKAAARGAKAEAWVARKVAAGMKWLDDRDRHPVMRAARGLFQAVIIRRTVNAAFPDAPSWSTYALSAAIPTIGDRATREAVQAEDAAIARAHAVLEQKDLQAPKGQPTPKREAQRAAKSPLKHTMTPCTLILTDTDRPAHARSFEVVGFVDELGEKYARMGATSALTHVEDLDEGVSFVGLHYGEVSLPRFPIPPAPEKAEVAPAAEVTVDVEETVRKAQATPAGRPPTLPEAPRAARRSPAGRSKKAATRKTS